MVSIESKDVYHQTLYGLVVALFGLFTEAFDLVHKMGDDLLQ